MNKLSVIALALGSGLALTGTVLAGAGHHDGKGGGGRMGHLDANKDGKVTLAEIVQSKQTWLREVDANKDGVATQAEIEASAKARQTAHVDQMLSKQDTNKDGRISRDESQMPPRWFARVDANADGALTREELSQKPGRHAGKGGKAAELDANKDGKIDGAEVKAAAERMLKRFDQNADGTLDATELRHGRHRGPGHRGPGGRGPGGQGPSKDAPAGTQPS